MEASSLCKRKGKRVNKMRELRQTTLQFVPVFASLPLHCTLSSSSHSTQQPVCVCLVSSTRGTSLWGEAPRRLAWFIPWADDHADVVIIYLSVCLEKVLRFLILYWSFSSGCHCQPASLRKAKQTHTVLPTRQTHTVCGMEAFANDNHFRSGLAPQMTPPLAARTSVHITNSTAKAQGRMHLPGCTLSPAFARMNPAHIGMKMKGKRKFRFSMIIFRFYRLLRLNANKNNYRKIKIKMVEK